MEKTLLFQLISTFSTSELRKWRQFVSSDFHCQNKHVRKLALILGPVVKKDASLSKNEVWSGLFPGVKYKEAKLNNICSDLLEVSNSFLAELTFLDKNGNQLDFLEQQLIDRGLLKHAARVAKKWKKKLDSSSLQNAGTLQERFRYHYLQDQLALRQRKREFGSHLLEKNLDFDRFYLLQQLMHHAEFLNRSNIVKGEYQLAHLDNLMRRYEENEQDVKDIPPIQIYVRIVKMLLGEEPHENFEAISILIDEFSDCFDAKENQVIYSYLLNFCAKQINSGDIRYYEEMFSLYKVLIDKDLLLQNTTLSQWTYTNIITVGLRLKEFTWIENFLQEYLHYLPSRLQHNAYHYNLAAIYFEREEYEKALLPLNELDFKDAFYQMAAKTIQLKIYYLSDELEAFEALEAASRQFIVRNKQLSEYQQKSNVNFIKLIKKMNAFRLNQSAMNSQKKELVLAQLGKTFEDSSTPLAHKDWLLSQFSILDN